MTTLNGTLASRPLDPRIEQLTLTSPQDFTLPSNVKKGMRVLVFNDTANNSLLTIKSSDASTVDTIRVGVCEVVALQDVPTASSHWKILRSEETGTWTPALAFSTGNGTATLSTTVATYVRRQKWITINLNTLITKGDRTTQTLSLSGLPYTFKNYANDQAAVRETGGNGWSLAASEDVMISPTANATTVLYVTRTLTSGATTGTIGNSMQSTTRTRWTATWELE